MYHMVDLNQVFYELFCVFGYLYNKELITKPVRTSPVLLGVCVERALLGTSVGKLFPIREGTDPELNTHTHTYNAVKCTACLTGSVPFKNFLCKLESPLYCKTTASQVSPECRLYHCQGNNIQLLFHGGCNITAVCCFYSLKRGGEEEVE